MDYRDFKETEGTAEGKKKPKKEKPAVNKGPKGYWWTAPEGSVHENVFALKRHLEEQQSSRAQDVIRSMALYGDKRALRAMNTVQQAEPGARLTLNVVRAVVNTVLAKTAKNRPKPSFVTSGGDWKLQQRAKKLDKFCQGQFYEADFYAEREATLKDAAVIGTGVSKFYADPAAGKVCVERVLGTELLIDDNEALLGKPRQLLQQMRVSRELLLADYQDDEKKRAAIEAAKAAKADDLVEPFQGVGDLVEVVEAWHLPSYAGASDGRTSLVMDGITLEDSKWTRDSFPFEFLHWEKPMTGFWGPGIAEQLAGIQLEINKLLRRIKAILDLCSTPWIFLERGSKVNPNALTNKIGTIIEFTGTRPTREALNQVPPELFQQLDRLYERAFQEMGVSQMSAQSRKPAGLDSGKALREFSDIESERFVVFGQNDERYVLGAGRQMIACAGELKKEKVRYKVRSLSRRFMEEISWDEVDLDDSKYVMQMFPTSSLPSHPAARKQTIEEMQNAGWIDDKEARRLLDMPDLESSSNIRFAAMDDIDSLVERLLESGEEAYQAPEPYQDLAYGLRRFQSAYLRGKVDGVPDDRLDLLRRWMSQAQAHLQPPAPPAAPAPAAAALPIPAPAPALPAGPPVPAPVAA